MKLQIQIIKNSKLTLQMTRQSALHSIVHSPPPIGLLTVYEMYGRSESLQTLITGEALPGRSTSDVLSESCRDLSGTDLPLLSRVDLSAGVLPPS